MGEKRHHHCTGEGALVVEWVVREKGRGKEFVGGG